MGKRKDRIAQALWARGFPPHPHGWFDFVGLGQNRKAHSFPLEKVGFQVNFIFRSA
jgi:hypothetical protein